MNGNHGDSSQGKLDTISIQLSRILQIQEESLRQKDKELEQLKRRLEEQQRELSLKDAELMRLEEEGEEYDPWEHRTTLDHGNLFRRHGGGLVNPYQDHDSSFCPQSGATFQHRGRRYRKSTFRIIDIVYGAILFVLIFHYFTSSPIPQQKSYLLDIPKTRYEEKPAATTVSIKPWESKPPNPIALMSSKEPFIQHRHGCIQAVRDKQLKIFKEFLHSDMQILLVDPAYHANVGDHMLTLGELHLVQKSLQLREPEQCHYVQANYFYKLCTDVVRASDHTINKVALWHAGGNWGDLWPDAQDVRIPSFKTILENGYSIIGLPQSLYYGDEYKKKKEVTEIKSKIALGLGLGQVTTTTTETIDEESDLGFHHRQTDDYWWNAKPSLSNQIVNTSALDTPEGLALSRQMVTLMWREKESFEEASRLYPFVSNILVPDMAFQLGPYQPIRKHPKKMVDVIIFLRKDHESKVNMERNQDSIRAILPKKGMTFRIVDWDDRRDLFDTTDTFFTDTAIQLLSLGKVVVCDRLHAAVLAYLSGLPFVYIDQVSGKVTKTLTAAFEGAEGCLDETLSRWSRATTLKEALSKASQLIDSEPSLQQEGGGFLSGVVPW